MKISVILAVYNEEKNIESMLINLLNQTYRNFEIIIINDGSIDNTERICKKYSIRDNRIKYFYQSNKGVAAARNLGLNYAIGTYITFLDGDDSVENNYLESLIEPFLSNFDQQLDLVICSYFQNGKQINFSEEIRDREFVLDEMTSVKGSKGYLWNKLFRANLIKRHKITFPEEIKVTSDFPFCIEYLLHSKRIQYISKPLVHYSVNENSISNNLSSNKILTQLDSLECIISLLNEANINHTIIRKYKQLYIRTVSGIIIKRSFDLNPNELKTLKYNLIKYNVNSSSLLLKIKFYIALIKISYEIKFLRR
ncbi:MAG: glycosyltransferase family 2 protein [Facklamia hominis]